MANQQQLKERIALAIKTNGEGDITGAVLQATLLDMVDVLEQQAIPILSHGGGDDTITIAPNKLHKWITPMARLEITLGEGVGEGVDEYMLEFTCPNNTPTTLILSPSVRWAATPHFNIGCTYQISIIDGLAVYAEWEAANT